MTEQAKEQTKNGNGEQPRKRVPLGTRNILTAPQRPGFVRRFVNDKGDRIESFKAAGWNAVDGEVPVGDPKIGRPASLGSLANPHVGGGQRAVLMEIPEEIYNEDRAASQAKITKVENEIKRNSKPDASAESYGQVSIS